MKVVNGILGLEGASQNVYLAGVFLILPHLALGTQGALLRGAQSLGGALGLSAFDRNSAPLNLTCRQCWSSAQDFVFRMSSVVKERKKKKKNVENR